VRAAQMLLSSACWPGAVIFRFRIFPSNEVLHKVQHKHRQGPAPLLGRTHLACPVPPGPCVYFDFYDSRLATGLEKPSGPVYRGRKAPESG
jgi:hypothetical protein